MLIRVAVSLRYLENHSRDGRVSAEAAPEGEGWSGGRLRF